MAGWQFRCVCCGELRDAPMARPEGTVYLRCIATRQWAWYEPSSFIAPAETRAHAQPARRGLAKAAPGRVKARVQRASAAGRRRAPARGTRKPASRKPARASRKRR